MEFVTFLIDLFLHLDEYLATDHCTSMARGRMLFCSW